MSGNTAWAASNICNDDEIKKRPDLYEAAGCNVDDDKTIMGTVEGLIAVVMSVVGIVAVGVIVYGGFTYVTSTGDAAKAAKAKNIIIYGVVGMIVALLSWTIVHFVNVSIS